MAIQSVIKPLYQRRLENMIKWDRKDFDLYQDFFKDLDEVFVNDVELQELVKVPKVETTDQKWQRFLKFQEALKIKLN